MEVDKQADKKMTVEEIKEKCKILNNATPEQSGEEITTILHYFPLMARGDAIRLMLHHLKIPFYDNLITQEMWPKEKESGRFEFKQLPVLQMGEKYYPQQRAILRYLGKKYNYYPTDVELAFEVDAIMDAIADAFANGGTFIFLKFAIRSPDWEKAIPTSISTYSNFLGIIEKILSRKENKEFIVGDGLTIADFLLVSCLRSHVMNPNFKLYFGKLICEYPRVIQYFHDRATEWSNIIEKAGNKYSY